MGELISVIIPAYNVGPYLENCLDSVLTQTYSNLEILLVDDGSTDETSGIADDFQEKYPKRIRVFHTENRGVTRARFEGIRAARGDWIGFVDGDDETEPDMYERLYKNAIQYNADISHCGHKTIVNGGKRIHEFYNTGRIAVQDRKDGLRDLLNGVFEPSIWNKIYRRTIIETLLREDVIDPSLSYYEDLLMNYYLFGLAEITVFEDFIGYHYMARADSVTRKGFNDKKVLDPVRVSKQILDDVSNDYKTETERNYIIACMYAYAALCKHKRASKQKQELRKILEIKRENWRLLRRNDRIKLSLLMISPELYNLFYMFYEKYGQKKKYE